MSVLVTCKLGAFTAVVMVDSQLLVVGQVGSPPPIALALLVTLGKAPAVGVTGMRKLTDAPTATLAEAVQVTCWLCAGAVQPAGKVPKVSVAGITSLMVMLPLVATVPLFVTFNS